MRTLQAAFARELSPAERASARRGEAGRREHGLYLRYEAPHRNAVWQADHKQLPVLVVPPGRRHGRRGWVTLFLDDCSRAVMGRAISLQPSSAPSRRDGAPPRFPGRDHQPAHRAQAARATPRAAGKTGRSIRTRFRILC